MNVKTKKKVRSYFRIVSFSIPNCSIIKNIKCFFTVRNINQPRQHNAKYQKANESVLHFFTKRGEKLNQN